MSLKSPAWQTVSLPLAPPGEPLNCKRCYSFWLHGRHWATCAQTSCLLSLTPPTRAPRSWKAGASSEHLGLWMPPKWWCPQLNYTPFPYYEWENGVTESLVTVPEIRIDDGQGGSGCRVIRGTCYSHCPPLSPASILICSSGMLHMAVQDCGPCVNARAHPRFHYMMKLFPEHLHGAPVRQYRERSRI